MIAEQRSASKLKLPSDREIVMEHVFDAPRELVFKTYTDPNLIPKWWGPRRLTTTIDKMEVRVGGRWRFVQHDAAGSEYAFNGEYREIVPCERISYTFEFEGLPGHVLLETVTFEEHDGKTKLTVTALFQSAEDRDGMLQSGMEEGATESQDRLAELLESIVIQSGELIVTRVFNAPRERVWKAWTEPERLAQWWGPKGFTMLTHQIDLRPGGVYHYCMRSPAGQEMWGKFVYREVAAPERLVFVNSFSDKDGHTLRHPMSATWPLEILNILTFTEHEGKTTITLQGGPLHATEEERQTFEAGRASVQRGMAGTFEQLDAYLAQAGEEN